MRFKFQGSKFKAKLRGGGALGYRKIDVKGGFVKKLALLALPVVFLLAGCGGGGGGGYGYNASESSYSDQGSYASSGSSGQVYNTSARSSAPPFGNYPVNYNATVRTTCSDGSCQTKP